MYLMPPDVMKFQSDKLIERTKLKLKEFKTQHHGDSSPIPMNFQDISHGQEPSFEQPPPSLGERRRSEKVQNGGEKIRISS